jgi:hypothetical protein
VSCAVAVAVAVLSTLTGRRHTGPPREIGASPSGAVGQVDTLLIGGLIYLVETPDVGCRRWWGCPPSLSPYLSVSGRRRHGPRCCAVDAGTQTYSHLLTHRAIGIQVDAATSSVAPSWSGLVDATAVHTGHPPSELLTHHRHWRFSRRTHHTHCRVSTLNHSLCCCRH